VVIAHAEVVVEMDYSDYGDYLIEKEFSRRQLKVVRDTHSAWLKKFAADGKRSILDFGAGAGYFVKTAQDMGFEVIGYEPSNKLREFASQTFDLNLSSAIPLGDGCFDAICMFDVIEHIPAIEQREILVLLAKKLTPGGLLIGNTPNIKSANIWIRRENDPAVWPPSHCSYFSTHSLDVYLRSLGLDKVFLYTKGFRTFRANKNALSFLERDVRSSFQRWTCIYPIKMVLRIFSLVLSPFGLGYQIYFEYRKPN
jgi:SAM-dependent methyltransferase